VCNRKKVAALTSEQLEAVATFENPPSLGELRQFRARLRKQQQITALDKAINKLERTYQLHRLLEERGDYGEMTALAEQGVNSSIKNGRYGNLFCSACYHGENEFARYLLRNGKAELTDTGVRIASLCLERCKMEASSEFEQIEIEALLNRLHELHFGFEWPLNKVCDCYSKLCTWMEAGTEYDEFSPELTKILSSVQRK
jgi:hypothetical protein